MTVNTSSGTTVLYNSKYLQLKSASSPQKASSWVYAHRPNAKDIVVVAPIIHNEDGDTVVFLETNRPPLTAEGIAKSCIELPAGLVGDNKQDETVEEAMEKELLEETGYKADKITIQNSKVASSPGCVSETAVIAIADISEDKIVQNPITDHGVIKAIHKVPLAEVDGWLKEQENQNKAIGAKTLAALYYVNLRKK